MPRLGVAISCTSYMFIFSSPESRLFYGLQFVDLVDGRGIILFDHPFLKYTRLLSSFVTFQRSTLNHQLHVMRGKGAFQEENIPMSDLRNASQARDFIDSDVGRCPMREGY